MANIYRMNRTFTGVESIRLTKLLYLEEGLINNSSPSVGLEATGDTTIMTVPAGISNIDLSIIKLVLLGSNTVGGLIASIGTNSPNFDNIVSSRTFTNFNTIGDPWVVTLDGESYRPVPGDVITMRVTNAVTGTGAIANVFMTGRIN